MSEKNPNEGIDPATLPYVTNAWGTAVKTLEARGEIQMMSVLVNREEKSLILFPAIGVLSKDMYAQLLKIMVLVHGGDELPADTSPHVKALVQVMRKGMIKEEKPIRPDLVLIMFEAWMLKTQMQDMSEEEVKKKIEQIEREGVRNQENRIEVVLVGWKTKTGEAGHQVRQIVRDEQGKPSLGDIVSNDTQMGNYSSRFLDEIFVQPNVTRH